MYASHPNIRPLRQVQQDLKEAYTWAYLDRATLCLCVWAAHVKAVTPTIAPQSLSTKGSPNTFKKSPKMVQLFWK